MVAMPYLLLGTVGFLVYRGLKQKAKAEQLAAEEVGRLSNPSLPPDGSPLRSTPSQGDASCLSHGESS